MCAIRALSRKIQQANISQNKLAQFRDRSPQTLLINNILSSLGKHMISTQAPKSHLSDTLLECHKLLSRLAIRIHNSNSDRTLQKSNLLLIKKIRQSKGLFKEKVLKEKLMLEQDQVFLMLIKKLKQSNQKNPLLQAKDIRVLWKRI